MSKEKLYFIVIAVLLVFCLIFGYKWYFGGNSASEERVKQLEKEFLALEEKKKASEERIKYWENQFNCLKKQDDSLKTKIFEMEQATLAAEINAKKSKAKFEKIMKELEETRKKIAEFKKNPPNRTGDLLLESLKNKTK